MTGIIISITPLLPPKLDAAGTIVDPGRPAPFVLTAEETARLLRVDHHTDYRDWLYRRRKEGKLRAFSNGRSVCYLLTSVIEYAQQQEDAKPR